MAEDRTDKPSSEPTIAWFTDAYMRYPATVSQPLRLLSSRHGLDTAGH